MPRSSRRPTGSSMAPCCRRGWFADSRSGRPPPRRHHSQQPPEERQAEESQQHQRFGKGEGEASDHALRPTLTPARAVPLLTIIPPCRNSSNSAAERLVVWVENSQSSLLVSARISSRCSASRAT